MGYWSSDIMGGDNPLDWKDRIYDICKVEEFTDIVAPSPDSPRWIQNKLTSKDLTDNLPEILKMIDEASGYSDDVNIALQVLGVLMMEAGAPIPEDLKKRMFNACNEDEWSKTDAERLKATDGMIKALALYDVKTPIVIRSRGLFEVRAEKPMPMSDFPKEIQDVLDFWTKIMSNPETLEDFQIRLKYVPAAVEKVVGPILTKRWLDTGKPVVTENEADNLIRKIVTECVLASLKDLELVDCIEDGEGDEVYWATEKGKEIFQKIQKWDEFISHQHSITNK